MSPSAEQIGEFKQEVIRSSNNPTFIHHAWFVKYHLEIVDQIATELLSYYPEADAQLVKILVWIHDYGKTIDFDNQYELTLTRGRKKLQELGFSVQFTDRVIDYITILDKKLELEINQAPIEVQVVSSADGCSYYVGPFMSLWWYGNSDKPFTELMDDNRRKVEKDWNRKIVLPEARKAFGGHHAFLLQQSGDIPSKFFS